MNTRTGGNVAYLNCFSGGIHPTLNASDFKIVVFTKLQSRQASKSVNSIDAVFYT